MVLEVLRRIQIWGETLARQEIWKNMAFVLIDFEKGCFGLLSLLHLSKKHEPSICNRILSNITTKVIPGCKV